MRSTPPLVVAAVALDGVLAGASLERSVVELPALRRLGASTWAQYARNADLRTGKLWFPALAIGGTALTIAAAIRRPALRPSAALAAAGLLTTILAGPNVMRVRRPVGPAVEAKSFAGFRRWQAVRAALQGLAFVAALIGVAKS